MKIRFFFAWFDLWVGAYYDRKLQVLYVCLLPCCVIRLETSKVFCSSCKRKNCDSEQDRCRGCGKIVCVSCCNLCGHFLGGEHGKI